MSHIMITRSKFKSPGATSKILGSSNTKGTVSNPITFTSPESPERKILQPQHLPRMPPRSEVISDDDLIILSGSTTPTYEDMPARRPTAGPKPPKKYSEKMKAEASVMQRIQDLQKEGMWYDKRLPKVHEPSRIKAQWDYLLEEMTWLSADFVYERKWKIMTAKKCSKMIEKYFHDRAIATQRAEKEEAIRKRRQCTYLAKEVRNFWANAQKLVEMSEKSRIELLRKKALDVHLSFIVKQTERYSSMLAETLATSTESQSTEQPAVDDSCTEDSLSPKHLSEELLDSGGNDGDFEPMDSEEDDEETISTAEEEAEKDQSAVEKEVALLAEESEIPMDDFLSQLPEGYLDWRIGAGADFDALTNNQDESSTSTNCNDNVDKNSKKANQQADVKLETEVKGTVEVGSVTIVNTKPVEASESTESSSEFEDDDETIHSNESKMDVDSAEDWDTNTESEDFETDGSETELGTDEDEDPDQTIGLASLLQTFAPERAGEDHEEEQINSVAAEAESFQPKGYTLSSTTVVTKVPFLLKHTLREYQHIGLDWLVAMYSKKLNGILADEMGLGKTIQTIALLAHLACEKGNWGPHLIVVPTSVMLNWEMEFKKWCPGFKILTYYGLQKERKLKRQGWTKPNTFHVCITSYKLVIQDHQSFRRKRWKYLILDEAQNIKNFKSQRWQLLLNFQTQRRLLLTGTPLQNNLMELWSLMHFLMPTVFQSHREFREWFSDPVSNMVEGDSSYDDNIIRRLHKVLRPFILRRLKSEVEKQLPQKYNHVILCRLSKRQRYLYEEFMDRANTKETLNKGNLLSVINVLMQLRKVCNHPNLFEPRPIISPFQVSGIQCTSPSLVWNITDEHKLMTPSFSIYKMTEADLSFGKEDSSRIRKRMYRFTKELWDWDEKIKCEKSTGDEILHPPFLPSANTMIETKELVKRPPTKKAKFSEAPPMPIIEKGLPFWMTTTDPVPFLADESFVSAVSIGAPPRHSHSPILVNGGSRMMKLVHTKTLKVDVPVALKLSQPKLEIKEENHATSLESNLIDRGSEDVKINDKEKDPSTPNDCQAIVNTGKSSFGKLIPKFDVSNLTAQELKIVKAKYTAFLGMKKYMKAQLENRKRKVRLTMRGQVRPWLQSIGYSNTEEFLPPEIQQRRLQDRRDIVLRLKTINEERCNIIPVIGLRTIEMCQLFGVLPSMRYTGNGRRRRFETKYHIVKNNSECDGLFRLGFSEIKMALFLKLSNSQTIMNHPHLTWRMTKGLLHLLWTLEEQLTMLAEVIKRFVIYVPAVFVPKPHTNFFRPTATYYSRKVQADQELENKLRQPSEILHPIVSRMSTQFPDPRLIEYDCGKLQVLNRLLRALKAEDHRVLLFTQMAKMLDVLEAFLNYHGHIYLRLDGATKIEERQILMERFNSDKRIFCFILSTRSGGIGVNLTGADTVIFYDSDWNPTMDAQAQDRCHRIGQTRDVNIYRLVSERTIEENILKKSNQKRILGELAIEGGNFTTAYFKKDSIYDLFNVDSFESADPLKRIRDDMENSTSVMDASGKYTRLAKGMEENNVAMEENNVATEDQVKVQIFESALAEAEDETDVQAARTVQAEAAAELAEFDENIPLEDLQDGLEDETPKSDVEMTIISAELTPVERYALRFMEHYIDEWSRETVTTAKKEIEHQKREWELEQLRKSEAEKCAKECPPIEDEDMITYPAVDARTQVTEPVQENNGNVGKVKSGKQKERRDKEDRLFRVKRRAITSEAGLVPYPPPGPRPHSFKVKKNQNCDVESLARQNEAIRRTRSSLLGPLGAEVVKSITTSAPKSANATAPKSGNTAASKPSNTNAAKSANTTAPKSANTTAPKSANTTAPKSSNTTAPKSSNTTAPKSANTTAAKSANTTASKPSNTTASRSANTTSSKSANTSATKSVPLPATAKSTKAVPPPTVEKSTKSVPPPAAAKSAKVGRPPAAAAAAKYTKAGRPPGTAKYTKTKRPMTAGKPTLRLTIKAVVPPTIEIEPDAPIVNEIGLRRTRSATAKIASFLPTSKIVPDNTVLQVETNEESVDLPSEPFGSPPKRKRGRPRKHPLPLI